MKLDDLLGFKTSIKEIQAIVEDMSKLDGVKAIYLFGSYAKNKNHKLSDIDLCIINDDNQEFLSDKLLEFASDNLDISLFTKLPIIIQFRVFREGKVLFIKDKDFVNKLKFATLRRYLDFKPAIDRFCRETLNV